jgi:PPOX class probable F420-dependent enzyme
LTLPAADRSLLETARRATLATIDSEGRPRLVPICFVVVNDVLWSPIDEKPKTSADPRRLARVRDIERDPRVTVLVDRWSEDWAQLAWLRVEGPAAVVGAEAAVIEALRAKYPQYASHDLESRPMIAVRIDRVSGWSASAAEGDTAGRPIE